VYYIKETLDKKNIKKSAKRLPFFLAFLKKKEKTLSCSLSNFFFTLVFRVSHKTLKLGAVKMSSVVAFLYSSSRQKTKGVSTFSIF
jgi:hypothetical protein